MPRRDFDDRRYAHLLGDSQREQTIARPTVEEIILATRQMLRCDPIEIFLLRAVILWPFQKRNEPDRMPPQRIDEARRDFGLPVIVGDGAAKKAAAMRGAQSFERIRIQPRAANPGKDRVEQMLRQNTLLLERDRARNRRGV